MSNAVHLSTEEGRRLALVIGVNGSSSFHQKPLQYAVNDAEAIAGVLQQYGDFDLLAPPLLGENATSSTIKTTLLRGMRNLSESDFLLFYFAGHSHSQYIEGNRLAIYLVTSDFDAQDVEQDPTLHLSMHWLRDQLFTRTKAGRVLVILDCCYAGGIDQAAPDHYLDELRQRLAYYLETPGGEVEMRRSGMRWALAATTYNQPAHEQDGHGVLTGKMLQALRGEVDTVLRDEGRVTLDRLVEYLKDALPDQQKPLLSGSDAVGKLCVLAWHRERARELQRQRSRPVDDRPESYLPLPRNTAFEPRPGEFEQLEQLLFGNRSAQTATQIGFIGVAMTGLGGVGKTQLTVELAYRYQERFSDGIFWMATTGTNLANWHRDFAELAAKTGYLPDDDDFSSPENQLRRAQHFCRYLANHTNVLLILDNVEDPELALTVLPTLAGKEINCTVLYTSRNATVPFGVTPYSVENLPPRSAQRLLLGGRPELLISIEQGSKGTEENAALEVCHRVGYLPLALVILRDLLQRDPDLKLLSLAEGFKQYNSLEIAADKKEGLVTTFRWSWEKVHSEEARRLLKLASVFPEAAPLPFWLVGLAAGLGERAEPWSPLGKVLTQLQEWSLIERLSNEQIRLHPLIRDFGLRMLTEDGKQGQQMLREAGERLLTVLTDLGHLEERARLHGYHACLQQVRDAYIFAQHLGTDQHIGLARIARWMALEEYLLGSAQWWPARITGLFYQQLYNRAIGEGHQLKGKKAPIRWVHLINLRRTEGRSLLHIFSGHTEEIRSAAFSPDGSSILTGSLDQTARLWDTATNKVLAIFFHTDAVSSVAFSPDGSRILTGSLDQTARLWDVVTNKVLATFSHTDAVSSVAFSPDGSRILTGSLDQTARLWDVATGKVHATFSHTSPVSSVAFSPDGSRILTSSYDWTACLWNVITHKLLFTFSNAVSSIAFSPDGSRILTGAYDGSAHLWDVLTNKPLATFFGHTDEVTSATFSPDGSRILTGSLDQTACLWEATPNKTLPAFSHTDEISSIVFSPDGSRILTGSLDQTARLWDTATGEVHATFSKHNDRVINVAFSPDSSRILTVSYDIAHLWDVGTGELLTTFSGHTNEISSVAFSPDGSHILTGSYDWTACLWNATTGQRVTTFSGHIDAVSSVAFSPDGNFILTGAHDGEACLWNATTGQRVATFPHTNSVTSVAFSPDGKYILTGSHDENARLWNMSSDKPIVTFSGHTNSVTSVAFSADSRLAITCCSDGKVYFWQIARAPSITLLGMYTAVYEIKAVAWYAQRHLLLADLEGFYFHPPVYQLLLEGEW